MAPRANVSLMLMDIRIGKILLKKFFCMIQFFNAQAFTTPDN